MHSGCMRVAKKPAAIIFRIFKAIDYSDVQHPFCTTSYAEKIYAELLADGTQASYFDPKLTDRYRNIS